MFAYFYENFIAGVFVAIYLRRFHITFDMEHSLIDHVFLPFSDLTSNSLVGPFIMDGYQQHIF